MMYGMALGLVTVKQEREISSFYEVQACVVSFAIDQLRSTASGRRGHSRETWKLD